ncbi:MAG: type 4a pilus biogenesis protein PilO [Azoarcus sp.]|jgi:type IV pilus assembly protein PilO|nr:type 4a pilus biogenesis protein PilO [Azoarcus sp.]
MGFDFQRLQNDFQGLNFNDPGVWPFAPRIAAFAAALVAVLVTGWFLDWSGQWSKLEKSQQKEQQLRDSWVTKKRQAVNIDEYRRQLSEINRQLETLVKQLPGKAEMESLLSDINQAGLGRGLQFDLFRPLKDSIKEFYAAVPVKISVTGSYQSLGEFASDVARMPRIVTIKNMTLTFAAAPAQGKKAGAGDERLRLDATAETYRYLEQDELATQQGAKK